MKFKCEKGDVFAFPAKRVVNSYDHRVENDLFEKATDVNTGYILSSLEVQVCPICDSKVFEEVAETDQDVDVGVVSCKLVPWSEIDAHLKLGYVKSKGKEYAKEGVKMTLYKAEATQP
jgi:hypothetical protein